VNDLNPYVVEMPVRGSVDDLWRIEFRAEGRVHYINNVSERAAHGALRMWHDGAPGRMISCRECPAGSNVPCPHNECPEQRGWLWTDMTGFRIMPMREAV